MTDAAGSPTGIVLALCVCGKPWFRAHCPDLFCSGWPSAVSLGRFLPFARGLSVEAGPGHPKRPGFVFCWVFSIVPGKRNGQYASAANLLSSDIHVVEEPAVTAT